MISFKNKHVCYREKVKEVTQNQELTHKKAGQTILLA